MDSFNEELAAAVLFGQSFHNNTSHEMNSLSSSTTWSNILSSNSISSLCTSIPTTAPPINHSKFPRVYDGLVSTDRTLSAPIVLNFESPNSSENLQQVNLSPLNHENFVSQIGSYNVNFENRKLLGSQPTKKKTCIRPPSQVYDHIIAERRRREHLSQLFIALSAIVPGLKKTDKNSILGDAVKCLKHLQERVETLQQTIDPVVVVKKSKIVVDDEGSQSSDEKAAEIEARVVNNNSILLRIHCAKQKGVIANLLSKVESLNMVVVNTNVTPFGSSELDITITAEMEKEFSLTVKEAATALREALNSAAA